MKKIIFLFFTTILISNIVTSQMKMSYNGNVGIGSITGDPLYKLHVNGSSFFSSTTAFNNTVKFENLSGYYVYFKSQAGDYLIIDGSGGIYGYQTVLYSSANNYHNLGKSNRAFKGIYLYNNYIVSDARQKENISDLSNSLDLILKLKGVKYDIKSEYAIDKSIKDELIKAKCDEERKNKIGFLAQDVQKILPEVVDYDDSTDVYTIDYIKIIPVLVEAIKELKGEIDDMESEKFKLKSAQDLNIENGSILFQNTPNPFTENTIINYYIPEDIETAFIYIYDMKGTQLNNIPIHLKGKGNVTINGGDLNPGMYMYTLIADNQVIETKRMILTD